MYLRHLCRQLHILRFKLIMYPLLLICWICGYVLADTFKIQDGTMFYSPFESTKLNSVDFSNALRSGLGKINRMVIPKSNYTNFPGIFLVCDGKGFMIDFSGSILQPFEASVQFRSCENAGLSNLIMIPDLTKLPYAQGTVISIVANSSGSNVTIRPHLGYRSLHKSGIQDTSINWSVYQYVFDPMYLNFNILIIKNPRA